MSDNTPTPPQQTRPTFSVLLVHTLPDGSSHLDWLIERPHTPSPEHPEPPEHRMLTFRCETDPTTTPGWVGLRLPDHRAHYIDYEGPVSGNRGRVTRRWRRPCTLLETSPARIRVRLQPPGADAGPHPGTTAATPLDLTLESLENNRWIVTDRQPAPHPDNPDSH